MAQLGTRTRRFMMRLYRHGMRRDPVSREALRRLMATADWAATSSNVVPVQFGASAGGLRA
jgi:nitroreductase